MSALTALNLTPAAVDALMRSIEMLAAGVPVTAIALDLGYSTASSFISVFRRTLGTTPAAYRQQL